MKFADPYYLLFLLAVPLYLFIRYFKSGKLRLSSTVLFSSTQILPKKSKNAGFVFEFLSDILLCASVAFLVIALARPQGGQDITAQEGYGIDIVLAIDVSGSMLCVDKIPSSMNSGVMAGYSYFNDPTGELFDQNRLNSAKKVISDYVEKQDYNRIGVVVFAGYSYTKCPLTLDKEMLQTIIDGISYNYENDGTAIGMGIATAVNRLKKSTAESKVIILLTDGVNNSGMIEPSTAAQIAREKDIRIYTIGLGNPEGALAPADSTEDPRSYYFDSSQGFDSETLQEIAEITGGKFYEAEDATALQEIYDDIDELEKSKYEVQRRILYTENFLPFLIAGAALLLFYILLSTAVIKLP